jgi:hypothetical protein
MELITELNEIILRSPKAIFITSTEWWRHLQIYWLTMGPRVQLNLPEKKMHQTKVMELSEK